MVFFSDLVYAITRPKWSTWKVLSNFSYLLISVQRIDNQLHHSANFSLESVFLSLLSKFFHLSHIQTIQFDSFLLPLNSFIICLGSISTFSNIFIYCGWFCLCWFFCLFFFCQAKSCKRRNTKIKSTMKSLTKISSQKVDTKKNKTKMMLL